MSVTDPEWRTRAPSDTRAYAKFAPTAPKYWSCDWVVSRLTVSVVVVVDAAAGLNVYAPLPITI
jgi:hypothetical protein